MPMRRAIQGPKSRRARSPLSLRLPVGWPRFKLFQMLASRLGQLPNAARGVRAHVASFQHPPSAETKAVSPPLLRVLQLDSIGGGESVIEKLSNEGHDFP